MRRDEIHSLEFITHVSIHAPREGCDRPCAGRSKRITSFNSRTPGGVRHVVRPKLLISLRFQFTHPGRGATRSQLILLNVKRCFNSRTPGGVRPNQTIDNFQLSRFQFTHPGRGATCLASFVSSTQESFNSRTPGGVRHVGNLDPNKLLPVSIHAPREGCDYTSGVTPYLTQVSIHAPREGCDMLGYGFEITINPFQFTHPGRGATQATSQSSRMFEVSIHAPREGCDSAQK